MIWSKCLFFIKLHNVYQKIKRPKVFRDREDKTKGNLFYSLTNKLSSHIIKNSFYSLHESATGYICEKYIGVVGSVDPILFYRVS